MSIFKPGRGRNSRRKVGHALTVRLYQHEREALTELREDLAKRYAVHGLTATDSDTLGEAVVFACSEMKRQGDHVPIYEVGALGARVATVLLMYAENLREEVGMQTADVLGQLGIDAKITPTKPIEVNAEIITGMIFAAAQPGDGEK